MGSDTARDDERRAGVVGRRFEPRTGSPWIHVRVTLKASKRADASMMPRLVGSGREVRVGGVRRRTYARADCQRPPSLSAGRSVLLTRTDSIATFPIGGCAVGRGVAQSPQVITTAFL